MSLSNGGIKLKIFNFSPISKFSNYFAGSLYTIQLPSNPQNTGECPASTFWDKHSMLLSFILACLKEKLRIPMADIWVSGADMHSKMTKYSKSENWVLSFSFRNTCNWVALEMLFREWVSHNEVETACSLPGITEHDDSEVGPPSFPLPLDAHDTLCEGVWNVVGKLLE